MQPLNKNIIIAIIIVVLIIGGSIGLTLTLQKLKNQSSGENQNPSVQLEPKTILQGLVTSINEQDKYIMVKEAGQSEEKEYKVLIADSTKIIKLELPFDPNNPPGNNVTFVPKKTEVKISGIKVNDNVVVKSNENFAGKNEVKRVEYIEILL